MGAKGVTRILVCAALLLVVALAVSAEQTGGVCLSAQGVSFGFSADDQGRISYTKAEGMAGVGGTKDEANANLSPVRTGRGPLGTDLLYVEQKRPFLGLTVFYLDGTSGLNLDRISWALLGLQGPDAPFLGASKSALVALTEWLKNDSPLVRSSAAEGLGRFGPKAGEALIGALRDTDPAVRCRAARALRSLGDKHALAAVEEALRRETDDNTRKVMEEAFTSAPRREVASQGANFSTGVPGKMEKTGADLVVINGETFFETKAGGIYLGLSRELSPILSPQLLERSRNLQAGATAGVAATIAPIVPMGFKAVAGAGGMHAQVDLLGGGMSFGKGILCDIVDYDRVVMFGEGEIEIPRMEDGKQIGSDIYLFSKDAKIVPGSKRGKLFLTGITHRFEPSQ